MANVRYPGTAGTTPGTITAADVTYDNTTSGLTADDVQEAIDEIEGQIGGLSYDASEISYDNTTSGLTADDVQEAIDEIEGQIGGLSYDASEISYDNTTSGLTADDVQEAIDEIDSNLDTLDGKVYKTDDSTETTIASDDLLPIYDTSATASKKITVENVVKATVSNPNLLDNPWFTVNQRRQSQYTAIGYGVDRWKLHDTNPFTVDVTDNGITLTHADNSNISWIDQFFEADVRTLFQTAYTGKKVTLSVMLADGTVYSNTGTVPTFTTTNQQMCSVDLPNGYNVQFFGRTTLMAIAINSSTANSSISIRAIKVELGSVSTLAMDTAPNYATELLKCQRYFVRLYAKGGAYTPLGFGIAVSTTRARITTPLPVDMRVLPSIRSNGNFALFDGSSSITVTVDGDTGGANLYSLGATGSGLTQGKMYQLRMNNDSTAIVDLSADL